jgi:hypothetical protein
MPSTDNTANLTPWLWNAPDKPFHNKAINFTHHTDGDKPERSYLCNHCGALVVYTTSHSGNRYLCDAKTVVGKAGSGYRRGFRQRSYFPSLWHSKSCTPIEGGGVHPKVREYMKELSR